MSDKFTLKIAGVVILYNPETTTIDNILSYSSFVETVYAIDNTEHPNNGFKEEIGKISNCIYLQDHENKGIANRLNEACNIAKDNGYQWLLTMDQDSAFISRNMEQYMACVAHYECANGVSVFGIEYENTAAQSDTCVAVTTNQLITSGSIVNLDIFKSVGDFNEALFIDGVDFDYCYRSVLKGYKVIRFKNIFLQHSLGKVSTHISLKNLKATERTLHAPIRLYYMTRNFLHLHSKYKKEFTAEIAWGRRDLLNRIKNNILYGNNRAEVVKYVLLGILDFRKNKMGKLQLHSNKQ